MQERRQIECDAFVDRLPLLLLEFGFEFLHLERWATERLGDLDEHLGELVHIHRRCGGCRSVRIEQRVLEELWDRGPALGRALEAALEHVLDVRVAERREGDLLARVGDGVELLVDVLQVRKGRVPMHHLIEDAAKRPDVRGASELEARLAPLPVHVSDGLGRHVVDGAHLRVSRDLGGIAVALLRDPKVDELERSFD